MTEWRGIDVVRSNASKVFMSGTMLQQRDLNGLSTRLGGSFRALLKDVIPSPRDRRMQTAFRLALLQWLKDRQAGVDNTSLSQFSFNEGSDSSPWMQDGVIVSSHNGQLLLRVPAFVPMQAIKAPADCTELQVTISVASCLVEDAVPVYNYSSRFSVPYHNEPVAARDITPGIRLQPESITLVVLSLGCMTPVGLLQDARLLPVRVVGVYSD